MVSDEKWKLNIVYISNFDFAGYVCEYHTKTGKHKEISGKKISNELICRGSYVNMNGKLIGLFESKNGPVFFVNKEQFPLTHGHYKMAWTELSSNKNKFRLEMDAEEILLIEYPKSEFIGIDCWSDEENVDFFLWLYKWQDNPKRFHAIYSGAKINEDGSVEEP